MDPPRHRSIAMPPYCALLLRTISATRPRLSAALSPCARDVAARRLDNARPSRMDTAQRPPTATSAPSGRCETSAMAITGVHAVLYTREAEADRAWLTDVLGLESIDAGGGWLIFALPPAELAAHPASGQGGAVELYLMCDDVETTTHELRDKGVAFD